MKVEKKIVVEKKLRYENFHSHFPSLLQKIVILFIADCVVLLLPLLLDGLVNGQSLVNKLSAALGVVSSCVAFSFKNPFGG